MFFDWSTLKKLIWLRAAGVIGAVWKTVTNAAVAAFTAVAAPVRALVVDIDPVQDLHGYDNPWPAGGGANKANLNGATVRNDGTYGIYTTIDFDKEEITMSGTWTPTSTVGSWRFLNTPNIPTSLNIIWFETTSPAHISSITQDGDNNRLIIQLSDMTNSTAYTIKFKLFAYDGTAPTTWAPYSNICPISGWSAVNVWRTGKNLLNPAERTVSPENIRYYFNNSIKLPAGTYTLSISEQVNGVYVNAEGVGTMFTKYNSNYIVFTLTREYYISFNLYKSGGINPNDTCQLEVGSTATPYEPYNGTTIPISWQSEAGTVYGGTLDVTTGVLTVTDVILVLNSADMNNNEDNPGWKDAGIKALIGAGKTGVIYRPTNCGDRYTVRTDGTGSASDRVLLPISIYGLTQTQWIALAMDVQILVPLATPTTYQLTPTEVTTLFGQNNVWADTGNINTITYRES